MSIKTNQQPDDTWKDDFLARSEISLAEFNALQFSRQSWLLANKHIFYNVNGNILNLLHSRNKELLATLKKSCKVFGKQFPAQ